VEIRWKVPDREVLEGVYPEGKPPFHPFPTVTEVVYAGFCPRAAYHYFLHALDPFRPWGRREMWDGERYHNLICLLEQRMAEGGKVTWQEVEGLGVELFGPNWKGLKPNVQDWWKKVRPARGIRKGEELFFELWVAGKVEVEGISGLFLRGKVDEIDKTKKVIVERTTKDKETALAQLKDFQLWLQRKILEGVEDGDRPREFRGEDFGRYRMILETPEEIVPVREKPEYLNRLKWALKWIQAIATERDLQSTWRQVFDASCRECSPREKKKGCELPRICFQRGFAHPPKEIRGKMRAELAPSWRSLRWEIMWEHDLHEYRLAMLSPEELEERGVACSASVVERSPSLRGLEVEVELPSPERAAEVEVEARLSKGIQVLLYGTLKMGVREKGRVVEVQGNRIKMFFEGVVSQRLPGRILFVSTPSAVIFTGEEPIYLEKGTQRDVYLYTTRGRGGEKRTVKEVGEFALLEAIFGTKGVVKG